MLSPCLYFKYIYVLKRSRLSLLCKDSDVLKSDHLVFLMNRVAEFCVVGVFAFGGVILCSSGLVGKLVWVKDLFCIVSVCCV